MRRWIILKTFRLYLSIDKKSEKFSFLHYLIIILVTATLTAYVKRFVSEKFSNREPAGNPQFYDYTPPPSQLPIHEALRGYRN